MSGATGAPMIGPSPSATDEPIVRTVHGSPHRRWTQHVFSGLALLATLAALPAHAQDSMESQRWRDLRRSLFGERPVTTDQGKVVELFVHPYADDAAVVPIMVRTHLPQKPARHVKHLWLVIDNNPSPFGVRFNFTPDSGKADIETRVRLESASPVRVIAELSDGSLWMDAKLVTGAGGCSAAGAKNDQAMRNLGKIRFSVDEQFADPGEPLLAHLRVAHPQFSGIGSEAEPPRFVREVRVYYADRLVMSADLDFTISENPSFRFYFMPRGKGELRAEIVDTGDLRVEDHFEVDPAKVLLK
jgi:sulfur-oxidizing protein SoxY